MICEVDVNNAYSVSTELDTVYFDVAQARDGWYLSAIVDSETGHFVDSLVNDDGPYATEDDALMGGLNAAYGWFIENEAGDFETDSRLAYMGVTA